MTWLSASNNNDYIKLSYFTVHRSKTIGWASCLEEMSCNYLKRSLGTQLNRQ